MGIDLIRTANGLEVKVDDKQFKSGENNELEANYPLGLNASGLMTDVDGTLKVAVDPFGGLALTDDGLKIAPTTSNVERIIPLPLILKSADFLDISDGAWHGMGSVIATQHDLFGSTPKGGSWNDLQLFLTYKIVVTGTTAANRTISVRMTHGSGGDAWSDIATGMPVNFGAPVNTPFIFTVPILGPVVIDNVGFWPDGETQFDVQLENPNAGTTVIITPSLVVYKATKTE